VLHLLEQFDLLVAHAVQTMQLQPKPTKDLKADPGAIAARPVLGPSAIVPLLPPIFQRDVFADWCRVLCASHVQCTVMIQSCHGHLVVEWPLSNHHAWTVPQRRSDASRIFASIERAIP